MAAREPLGRRCSVCGAPYETGERFCPLDGGAVVDAEQAGDPLVGRTIGGRYFVRRLIARGGMGAVYEAEHVGLDKRVAVKLILDRFTGDREAIHRFHREARTASRIGHENIVDITDVGETEEGKSFLVMEYLEGGDLGQVLAATGQMEPSRAVHIVGQVLRGLAAAHAQGIIHRDMKPANVFLTARGGESDFVKIMDFGISKVVAARESRVRLTDTGVAMGTPIYMAPEQAEARPDLDHRIDIYAVGVMLYEMLAGHPPFEAPSYLALVQQHVSSPVPPLAGERPDLPPPLVRAVHRALEKDPARRFGDALAFAAALPSVQSLRESWEAGVTAPVKAGGERARVLAVEEPEEPPRRRARWWAAIAALAAGGAVAGMVLVGRGGAGDGRRATGDEQRETSTGSREPGTERPAPVVEAIPEARLEIDSAPRGAQVFVDGEHKGKTPVALEQVAVGTHVIRIEARGHEELEAAKEVRAGHSESFFAVLARRGSGRRPTVTSGGKKVAPEARPAAAPRPPPAGDGKPNPYVER